MVKLWRSWPSRADRRKIEGRVDGCISFHLYRFLGKMLCVVKHLEHGHGSVPFVEQTGPSCLILGQSQFAVPLTSLGPGTARPNWES